MGLDMYLSLEKSEASDEAIATEGKIIKTAGKCWVNKSWCVGYWRKANQVHKWFVDNVGDGVDECQKMYCSLDDIKTLHKICIDIISEPSIAEARAKELLPTSEGFFFGPTEYGEWYWDDIKNTIEITEAVIEFLEAEEKKEDGARWGIIYQASW